MKSNLHPNDSRINFDIENHFYSVDGNKIKYSVTQIIDQFFPEFDSEYWSRIKAKERLDFLGKKYSKEQLDQLQQKILGEWDLKRDEASKKGTILHETIENYYKGIFTDDPPVEFSYFESFINKYPKMKPYKTEWRVFDSKASLAGTIDMVYEKPNGELFLFDWKRSSKLVNDIGAIIKSDFEYGFDELNNLSNNSYNKYCLQQNLYKYILEENYDKKISSMNILVLHPRHHKYFHLQLPSLKKETEFLVRKAREKSI